MTPKQALANRITPLCQRVDDKLSASLDTTHHPDGHPARLLEAMRYSLFNGGKRIRPVLVYAACEALEGNLGDADNAAAAVECIHAYSLIHDDLPAMDDDDLRRGKPTCHIAFDEATAILAGDALQSLAFELLANNSSLTAENRLSMLLSLSRASGASGMVAGQALDMDAEQKTLELAQLERVHNLKTGALINASVELGARASGRATPQALAALAQYSNAIGLAFQVQDDILDIESDTLTLGKTQGADQARGKSTYPAILGLDGAHTMAHKLHQLALDALQPLPQNTELLRLIADYIISRDH